jgi:hypothetical protein
MDPNAALENARKLAAKTTHGSWDTEKLANLGEELAETFQGLDEWLSRGGFKPDAWQ